MIDEDRGAKPDEMQHPGCDLGLASELDELDRILHSYPEEFWVAEMGELEADPD
jgi:hypothetical protein